MNWIKSTDRLPEDLPEYAGRKAIKCLVAYKAGGRWQWTSMERLIPLCGDQWSWPRGTPVDYWCIPENPYMAVPGELRRTGLIQEVIARVADRPDLVEYVKAMHSAYEK